MKHFTYYTIIGKDLNLLKGHVENIKYHAGFDKLTCPKEFLMIVYRNNRIPAHVTNEILDYCHANDIRTEIYDEPTNNFIENLYACWNLGYEKSQDGFVFRGGSDQVFNKDSFISLVEQANKLDEEGKKFVLQANTVECKSRLQKINAVSRHFARDFGESFDNLDLNAFERFVDDLRAGVKEELLGIYKALEYWKHPTPAETTVGWINRCDGCSWLMKRQDWVEFGPLPVFHNMITGDVAIHDYLMNAGYRDYIVRDCVTYHFVQGERTT
jgi:hypothetical protein